MQSCGDARLCGGFGMAGVSRKSTRTGDRLWCDGVFDFGILSGIYGVLDKDQTAEAGGLPAVGSGLSGDSAGHHGAVFWGTIQCGRGHGAFDSVRKWTCCADRLGKGKRREAPKAETAQSLSCTNSAAR